jgi:uncharacterized Rossmann fold enzyme
MAIDLKNWIIPPRFRYLARIAQGKEPRSHITRFIRDVAAWTAPREVQRALFDIYYGLKGVDVARNAELKDRYRGQRRCFVIGNGASLKDMDLSVLANEITIGCNSFYKHEQARRVDLKYHCVGDPMFFENTPRAVEWHREIESAMPRATKMFHARGQPLVREHGLYRDQTIYYYRHGITVDEPELVDFDFTRPLCVGHTTGSRLAIPLAIYMGFTEIYIIGFDANWMESYRGSYHFYEKHALWPEFDAQATDKRHPRYADQLINALRDFESHALLYEAAKARGVNIYNAGKGGLLDTYPRVVFEELF